MLGKCKLCLKEDVDLQKSHLLSQAIYKTLRGENGPKNPNPYQISREGSVQSSKQQRTHLLCRPCEAILSKNGENWFFRNGMKADGRFPLADVLRKAQPSVGTLADNTRLYEAGLIPEIDSLAMSHFATGIFWKASVHGWNDDGRVPVNLFGYADQFRRFLLGEREFPQNAVLTVVVRERGLLDRLTYAPAGSSKGATSSYRFPIPGFNFMLTIGSKIPQRTSQYCFVRGVGKPIVVTSTLDTFLMQEAQDMLARNSSGL
jgi:hypothetical protein